MRTARRSLVLAVFVILNAPRAATGQGLALLDVPFFSQSEDLCGGAAAAMVLRFWGDPAIIAEDFSPLVDKRDGGIRMTALATAIRARGWQALLLSGTDEQVKEQVDRGRPVIALIEDRPHIYHYVVIVGWDDRAVVIHDPARNPFRVIRRDDFERRWRQADSWAMVILPTASPPPEIPAGARPEIVATSAPRCQELLSQGVSRAQANDLETAERLLADAAHQCPTDSGPLRELAGVRALQRRWDEAGDLASEALRLDPHDEHAGRILATSRFIADDTRGALTAWNAVGEPIVNLVQIEGLSRTRSRAVERYLGIPVGRLLTPAVIARANRRLGELPAAAGGRIDYLPAAGRADVRVVVNERSLFPHDTLAWAITGGQAAFTRELTWTLASLSGGGERLNASWRFWPDRPRYALMLAAPTPAGIVSVSGFNEIQPFTDVTLPVAERSGLRTAFSNWATGRLRWEVRGGVDDWRSIGRRPMVGGTLVLQGAAARIDAALDAWTGRSRFLSTQLTAGWQVPRRSLTILARAALGAIAGQAPLDIWPAGDTGSVRTLLLRAHPLLDRSDFRTDRMGRVVLNGSVGIQRWTGKLRPFRIGGAAFMDAGRTLRRTDAPALNDADVGVGFRAAFPGFAGTFRVDVARGLRDAERALSFTFSADPFAP